MAYLLDSNIVLRFVQITNPLYQGIWQTIDKLRQSGETIVLVPQILVEFWVVATRPTNVNGLGMTTEYAERELKILQNIFTVLPENERIFEAWKILVAKYKISGKSAHDARIVAAMTVHKVENILTLNAKDFKRFAEINAVEPQEV